MKNSRKILISVITLFVLFNPILEILAVTVGNETGISLQVSVCNNNGICEPAMGETIANCPADCGCNNNGVCEPLRGEASANCPLDCPADTGGIFLADTTPPVIYNLLVSEITLNSADISWETNEYALCQLFWGRTEEYELEAITEVALYKEHSTKLIKLAPNTTYHFKIFCQDSAKNESETTDQKFTTLTLPDITPPTNVLNFEAIPGDGKIELKWQNPPNLDFKAVKIMRSTDFYPSDPEKGIPIYNDKGNSFTDTGLINGMRYYYTAFAYDKTGNYSSGAIVSAVPQEFIPPEEVPPEEIPPTVPPEEVPPEIERLNLEDFNFWQDDKKITFIGNQIKIGTEEPVDISIDYEKVPEVLKTIMVILERPAYIPEGLDKIEPKKYFSFLLRINKEKTKYLATIFAPEPGTYPLTLLILDYKNQSLKKIKGQLIIEGPEIVPTSKIPWYKNAKNWLYLLFLLLVLAVIAYLIRKKLKKFKKEESFSNHACDS